VIRLFVGIAIDAAVAARLAPLAAGIPGARWVAARNLHLTLRFIGEVDDGLAEDIHLALAAVESPGFALDLEGLGIFGGGKPHTLWAGVRSEPLLERLQGRVDAAVERTGCPPEPRKFTAHVTLARLGAGAAPRIPAYLAGNSLFRAGPMPVDHFVVREIAAAGDQAGAAAI